MRFFFLVLFTIALFTVHAQLLYQVPKGAESRVSSPENLNGLSGAGGKANSGAKGSAFVSLKAGASQTLLEISQPGIIQRIWITISDRSPAMLRSLRLRMYWDQAGKPAVDVPFGDFFCANTGKTVAFQSAFFSDPEGRSFNCYIPMPFQSGAKIVLTNEGSVDLRMLFFDVDFVTLPAPEKDILYFHAGWHRSLNGPVGQDLELLPEVTGRGRFLGVSVGLNTNPVYGNSWWGEGEVKMYLDGDRDHPTINGTGAEDYIGTGWSEGKFANLYQGCLVADGPARQYAFYRFHVPDAIYFERDCKVTMQQLGGYFAPAVKELMAKGVVLRPVSLAGKAGFRGLMAADSTKLLQAAEPEDWLCFYRSDDYAVTAYFYLDQPQDRLPELAPVHERTQQ